MQKKRYPEKRYPFFYIKELTTNPDIHKILYRFFVPADLLSPFYAATDEAGICRPPVFRNGTPYDKLTILYSSACSSSILIRFDFVCLDCGSMYVI